MFTVNDARYTNLEIANKQPIHRCHISYSRINQRSYKTIRDPHGRGTLILSYIRRLGSFLGFKNLNFNIFGGFQKN